MEKKNSITDEQIVSFLSGTASEEEQNAVLEYVAESDENLDELMSIAEAVYKHRKSRHEKLQASEQLAHQQPTAKHAIIWRKPKPIVWRVAASVAVVLVAGGLLFALAGRGSNPETGNQFAINTTENPNDTLVFSEEEEDLRDATNDIQHTSRPNEPTLIAESAPEKAFYDSYGPLPMSVSRHVDAKREGGALQASSQVATSPQAPSTTNPPETYYNIIANVPERWKMGDALHISWKCNAPELKLIIRPQNSNVWMYNKTFPFEQDSVVISSSVQEKLAWDSDTLVWRMTVLFDNGKQSEKHGTIVVVK